MFGTASMLEPAAGAQGAARPVSAGVAELADALDLGSSDENRGGSNPPARTSGPEHRSCRRAGSS